MSTRNNFGKTETTLLAIIFMTIITLVTALISVLIVSPLDIFDKSENTDTIDIRIVTDEEATKEDVYTVKSYSVQSGDSYWSISVDFYDTGLYYKALARYNKMDTTDMLRIGQSIKIPDINDPEFINLFDTIQNENKTSIEMWNHKMAGTTINAGPKTTYKYGQRSNPAVDITVPELDDIMKNYTGTVDTSTFTKLGSYKITGYTPSCEHCCENTDGTGAAGVNMICGYSVAAPKNIPFGTTLYIEGYGFYVVEDRGYLGTSTIDIACPTHNACYAITNTNINVYVVPNN